MSANPQENRAMTFTTRCPPDRHTVELTLTDYGTGIPDDSIDHIFEPFFTSKERGLGLGLSICRSIMLEHRGTLTARNNPGGGATLKLTLPAADQVRAHSVGDRTTLRDAGMRA
jgi:signal transduction histidine kinase